MRVAKYVEEAPADGNGREKRGRGGGGGPASASGWPSERRLYYSNFWKGGTDPRRMSQPESWVRVLLSSTQLSQTGLNDVSVDESRVYGLICDSACLQLKHQVIVEAKAEVRPSVIHTRCT
jgi:hypothetical protein